LVHFDDGRAGNSDSMCVARPRIPKRTWVLALDYRSLDYRSSVSQRSSMIQYAPLIPCPCSRQRRELAGMPMRFAASATLKSSCLRQEISNHAIFMGPILRRSVLKSQYCLRFFKIMLDNKTNLR
jgi:hypothetical protein